MNAEENIHIANPVMTLDKPVSVNQFATDDMGYNYEIKRIQSFESWPVHYPVDPARLAKSGFYYEGKADEVKCFSCHGEIKDWKFGDIVQKKHMQLFPNCDFIQRKSNNIPVNSYKSNSKKDLLIKNNDNLILLKNAPAATEKNIDNSCPPIHLDAAKESVDVKQRDEPNFEKMKSEEERLKTFSKRWPVSCVNASEIASAGFFYLGYADKVQCPFCRGIVSNWEDGDNPLAEHAKHFPWCDYLQSIGYTKEKTENSWYTKPSYDTCGSINNNLPNIAAKKCKLLDINQQSASLKKLGVHLHKGPVHPQQAPLAARLRSFLSWPSAAPVTKEELANAGFFYIGISDHTKCFQCDGGLCNWEPGDDPWVEHARWFPTCDFVRLNKGEAFINSCKLQYPTLMDLGSGTSRTSIQTACSSSESLMTKVDAAMKSSLIAYILESNLFPANIVRVAVMRQIKETGSSFSSVDELCQAVAYLTEEMEPVTDIDVPISGINLSSAQCTNSKEEQPEENPKVQTSPSSSIRSEGSSLEEENRFLKDQCLCKVCMDKEVGIVFLPCGHLLACTLCAPALKICPMCRKTIHATVRAYLP